MMRRREFLGSAAVGAVALGGSRAASAAGKAEKTPNKEVRIKLGHQHDHSPETLRLLAAFGVTHICSGIPSRVMDENWSVEGLTRLRTHVESFGIQLAAVPLPMSSSYITKAENPEILLGKDPQRDQEIENICQMLRNAGKAGIPLLKY